MNKIQLKERLLTEETRIHNEIREIYPNCAGLDGIICVNKYIDLLNPNSNPLKILWILKEKGFPRNRINQEFDNRVYMLYVAQYSRWRNTYGNMCSITEGILEWQRTKNNKYLCLENLPELKVEKESGSVYYMPDEESPDPIYPLDYIAFLNVKKNGSYRNTSNQGIINAEYTKPEIKKILNEQINYINPDIIILGNQVQKLAEDITGIPLNKFMQCGTCKYTFDNQNCKLIIFANHPNVYGHMTNSEYCNSIFNAIKQNEKELLEKYTR